MAINYAPEVTGIAPYVTDMARRLAARGWNVRVITGYPHYPEWRMHGSEADFASTSVIDGVIVVRVPHSVPQRAALVPRSRMELEFGWHAIGMHLRRDAMVVLASPPLIASAMVMTWRGLRGRAAAPVGVWVHDLYSQAVTETGSGSYLSRSLVRRLESHTLRAADEVAVVHPRFGDILVHRLGVRRDAITEIPNWNQARPQCRMDRYLARTELGIPDDEIVAVHAGNMGVKQGLENLVEVARLLDATRRKVRIYLVGDGNQRRGLEQSAQGLDTITFIDSLPDNEFHRMLSAADVLLVNEKTGVAEMSIPSKLTTYFSYGLPVVAAVAERGITAAEVRQSGGGVVVPAGDPARLIAAIERVAADDELAASLGAAGKAYSDKALGVDTAVSRFEDWLNKLAGRAHASARTDLAVP
ncbi:glycosyltransferase family 4 protein [Gordonia sp. ABSL49_1]|uniref:glycosyltransferase family 4 protein n=1 Tax=Gordonia sp. ABSL49_1 TaxID=2920941 RepID=UPI001F0E6342|nr:glycosyltransferase family 4 protein [Gordonia sp. ABSL49_1]MCH5645473.1 glycosyltransferase family 4 protein [Gordonia sp. ABSL49_1]